jgi:hypothetical protein
MSFRLKTEVPASGIVASPVFRSSDRAVFEPHHARPSVGGIIARAGEYAKSVRAAETAQPSML